MIEWLKVALGIVCFAIGAASLLGAIASLIFVDASEVYIPASFGAFGAALMWVSVLLLRSLRWHND